MKNPILLLLLLFFWATSAGAQDCQKLASSNTGSGLIASLLGDDAQSITEACQVSAGDDQYSVRVEYQGFSGKKYHLIGQLLNSNRRKVDGCEPVSMDLEQGATSADLTFRFEAMKQNSNEPYVGVRYLKVTIADADDPLSDFNLGGLTLTGTSAEYRIDHQFRAGIGSDGTSNVSVSVSFTPVKRAATIKQ